MEELTMEKNTEKKNRPEEISEDALDQVNGGFGEWIPGYSEPDQFNTAEDTCKESPLNPIGILRQTRSGEQLRAEELAESAKEPRVRSNNIRNRRV